jgi:hypothetical protein
MPPISNFNFRPYRPPEESEPQKPAIASFNFRPYEAPTEQRPMSRPRSALHSLVSEAGRMIGETARGAALFTAPPSTVFDVLDQVDQSQEMSDLDIAKLSMRIGPRAGILESQRLVTEYARGTPEQRQAIRGRLVGQVNDAVQSDLYKAGDEIDSWFRETFPTEEAYSKEWMASKIPGAVGSALGFLAPSIVLRGAARGRMRPVTDYGVTGTMGSFANRSSHFTQAIQNGADIPTALEAADLGGFVGASEAVPLGNLLNRIDRVSGGAVKRWLMRAVAQGTEEGVQEAFAGIMDAAIAQKLYDPTQGIWTAQRAEEGALGFTTGALLETIMTLALPGRARAPGAPPRPGAEPRPEPVAPTIATPEGAIPAAPEPRVAGVAAEPAARSDLPTVDLERYIELPDEGEPPAGPPAAPAGVAVRKDEEIPELTDAVAAAGERLPPAAPEAQMPLLHRKAMQQIDTQPFKNWFGNSRIVDEEGAPRVLYHGTTHDFDAFTLERGNAENSFGRAYYFTDDTHDASVNYGGEGPDLTQRIELYKERLEGELGVEASDLRDEFESFAGKSVEDMSADEQEEKMMEFSRARLSGRAANVMPVFVKMENPADLISGKFEYQIDWDYYREIAEDEVDKADFTDADGDLDEDRYNEAIDEKSRDIYYEDFRPKVTGNGAKLLEAITRVAQDYNDIDGHAVRDNLLEHYGLPDEMDGRPLREILDRIKSDEKAMYVTNNEGELAIGNYLRDVLEEAGYDGIIQDAWNEFGGGTTRMRPMDMAPGTKHYVVFDPKNVKSATGNRGTFDPTSENITFHRRDEGPPRRVKGTVYAIEYTDEAGKRRMLGEGPFDSLEAAERYIDAEVGARFPKVVETTDAGFDKRVAAEDIEMFGERPAAITDTPAFNKWFGDSKVVDEHGNPLVVYHGSPRGDITEFSSTHTGATTGNRGWFGTGFYFTGNRDYAEGFAEHVRVPRGRRHRGKVYAVYLSLQNPFRLDLSADKLVAALHRKMNLTPTERAALNKWHRKNPDELVPALTDEETGLGSDWLRAVLERNGYDGIIAEEGPGDGTPEYIAFRPSQIKSATDNRGTFDVESADITFHRRERGTQGPTLSTFRNTNALKDHPAYKAAKGGDLKAAEKLVRDLVTDENIEAAKKSFGSGALFVWPHSSEVSGYNAIPSALAARYAQGTGGKLAPLVIQVNHVFHTGANAMERLIARPAMEGEVTQGARYVVVDDVTTLGGTLSELANHVNINGGEVVGSVVLVDASRTQSLAPTAKQISEIERRFGDEVRELFEIEPAALTQAEATYILGFRDADSLRKRAAKAERERSDRLHAKGVQAPVAHRRAPTETAEFKRWFGDSKVVDANGDPLVVYHGTNADVSVFAPFSHFGTAAAANQRAEELRSFSVDVVRREPGSFSVVPVYLSIQNPLRMQDLAAIDDNTGLTIEKAEERGTKDIYPRGWEGEEAIATTLLEMGVIDIDEFEDHRSNRKALQLLQEKGYDGIIYENVVEDAGSDSYIVFAPSQIKSAIGNRGTFSIESADITAHRAPAQPTEAQAETGNYKKDRQLIQGMPIAIETKAGEIRRGEDKDGKAWERKLRDNYGYLNRTEGADGEQIDVFAKKGLGAYVKPGAEAASTVYVVNQMTPDGKRFDEHKVVLGAKSLPEARLIYKRNFEPGWKGMGTVLEMPVEAFREWIKTPQTTPLTEAEVARAAAQAGVELKRGTKEAEPARKPVGRRGYEDRRRAVGRDQPRTAAPQKEVARRQALYEKATNLRDGLVGRLPQHSGLPQTRIALTWRSLPEHLRRALETAKEPHLVTGIFDPTPGQSAIYLIADGIKNADDALEVWTHEMVGHYGLRSMLGSGYGTAMDEIATAFETQVRMRGRQYFDDRASGRRFDWNNANQRRVAAEEFVAHTAQKVLTGQKVSIKERTLLDKILDLIRNALRALGVRTRWTEKQLLKLINDAAHYVASPHGRMTEAAALDSGFRRHELPPTYYSQLYKAMTDTKTVPESSTIAEYKRLIEGKVKKGEIKEEEVKWTGIKDALDSFMFTTPREIATTDDLGRVGEFQTFVTKNPSIFPKRIQELLVQAETGLEAFIKKEIPWTEGLNAERIADFGFLEGLMGPSRHNDRYEKAAPEYYNTWREIGERLRDFDTSKLRVTKDWLLDIIRTNEVTIDVVPPTGGEGSSDLFAGDNEENPDGYHEIDWDYVTESAREMFVQSEADERIETRLDELVDENWDQEAFDKDFNERYGKAVQPGLFGPELLVDKNAAYAEAQEEWAADLREELYDEAKEEALEKYQKELERIAQQSAEEDRGRYWISDHYEISVPYADSDEYHVTGPGGFEAFESSFDDAVEAARKHAGGDLEESTHWSSYTLPGGKNYRERLFKWNGGNDTSVGNMDNHFSQDNDFVVHARFDERKTADGMSAIFVDEMQSDWHQFNRDQQKDAAERIARRDRAQARVPDLETRLERAGAKLSEHMQRLLDHGLDTDVLVLQHAVNNGNAAVEEVALDWMELSPEKRLDRLRLSIPIRAFENLLDHAYGNGVNVFAALQGSEEFRSLYAEENKGWLRDEDPAMHAKHLYMRYLVRDDLARVLVGGAHSRSLRILKIAEKMGLPMPAFPKDGTGLEREQWTDEIKQFMSSTEGVRDLFAGSVTWLANYSSDPNRAKPVEPLISISKDIETADNVYRDIDLHLDEARAEVQRYDRPPEIVPAPFEDTYMVLVAKWMIQEAVRLGHKRVLFAPGAMHSVRWHSGVAVDGLDYKEARARIAEGKLVQAHIPPFGGEQGEITDANVGDYLYVQADNRIKGFVRKDKLKYLVGPRVAQLVLDNLPPADVDDDRLYRVLRKGDERKYPDYKVLETDGPIWFPTGEPGSRVAQIHMGSLAIYDEIYVNKINRFLKKYKAKIVPGTMAWRETATERARKYGLELAEYGVRVMQLDITPELEHAAGTQGFPLFHRRDLEDIRTKQSAILSGDTWHVDEGSRFQRIWNFLVYQLQNKFESLLRTEKEISRFAGAPIPEALSAYLKEEMYHSRIKYRIDQYDKEWVEPLIKMVKDSGYSWEDVEMYLYARHAPEANAKLATINKDSRYNSGMTNEEAAEVMTTLKSEGEFGNLETIGAWIDRMTKLHRDTLVSEGLEPQEVIDAWEATYDYYVPLKGIGTADDAANLLPPRGRGYDIGGPSGKRRLGRTTRADSILANIVAQQQATFIRAEKARVGRALLALVERFPNPDFWSIDKKRMRRYLDTRTGQVITSWVKPTQFGSMPKTPDNVLSVRIDGVDHWITVNDKNTAAMRMIAALKNLNSSDVGLLTQALHAVNRGLSALNTSLNPEFVVSNLARDLQTAFVNLSATSAEGAKKQIMKNIPAAMRGIYRNLFKNDTTSEWAKHFDEYRRVGGQVGWIDNYKDINDLNSKLQRQLRDMDARFVSWTTAMNFFRFIERANLVVENATRLSAYVEARRLGLSEERAASLAKNLTVNFNRKGNAATTANALYMFYNASIQGAAVIWQAAKSPRARQWMYGIVAFAAVMDIAQRLLGGLDDDDEWRYDKIDESVKERNLIVMLPFWMQPEKGAALEDYYFKIPLPYGYNVLHTIGRKVGGYLDYGLMGNKRSVDPIQDAMEIVLSAAHSFNPIGTEASIVQTLSPTITDPLVQIATNQAWHGGPIVPEVDPFDPAPSPMSERYFKSVSEPSRWLAEQMNRLGGGTETRPSQLPILDNSPETLDHLMEFITGGAGRFITNMAELGIALADEDKDLEVGRIPFVRRVFGETGTYEVREIYYEHIKDIEYADKELAAAIENGDAARQRALWQDYGVQLRMRNQVSAVQRQLRRLRTQRRAIETDGWVRPDDREKRVKELEDQMDKRMDEFNRMFNQAQDQARSRRSGTARVVPFVNGRTREEAVASLEDAGLKDTAALLASLPIRPRKAMLDELRRTLRG